MRSRAALSAPDQIGDFDLLDRVTGKTTAPDVSDASTCSRAVGADMDAGGSFR
jgi:hypothetical protein